MGCIGLSLFTYTVLDQVEELWMSKVAVDVDVK